MTDTAARAPTARFFSRIEGPAEFRRLLEKRGPIFVKIGQFLALRPDLIPREYCQELMQLFERVRPFPWQEARQIIKEDLAAEPTDLFAYIEPRPLASGSLAQTHFARLKNGAEVAVKILRPDVKEQVERDLRRARRLVRLLELSRTSFILSPRDVLSEVSNWLRQELDLRQELANIQRLRRLTARSRFQSVPRPYPELSGPRVLTARYVRGVHVIDLLSPPGSRAEPEPESAEQADIDRDLLAEHLIEACLTQIFQYRFFHADLHPGNLIAIPPARIAFVDFGLCDELDETVRKRQMHYLSALYNGENEQVFRSLQEILLPTEHADPEALRRDFFAAVRSWSIEKQRDREVEEGVYNSPVANYMIAVMQAARRSGYQVPTGILAMYRALLTAESVAQQLGGGADLRSVGTAFFERLRLDEAFRLLNVEELRSVVLSYYSLWREYPGQLSQILADLADSRFVLKVNVSENPDLKRDRNRRTRAVVTSIVAVSVAVLLAALELSDYAGGWIGWLLMTILALLYIATFLQYWRLN